MKKQRKDWMMLFGRKMGRVEEDQQEPGGPVRPAVPRPTQKQGPRRQGGVQSMSRIVTAAVVVAIVAAGYGAYATYTSNAKVQAVEGQTAKVLVATTEIQAGQEVSAAQVTMKEVPKTAIPEGALDSAQEATGKVTLSYVPKNAIMTGKNLAGDMAATAAGRIADGHVAMSVTVSQQSGVAGLLHQGDAVSVLATVDDSQGESAARVLAEHARVLSLDAALDGYDPEYTAVTIEVEPADAQKVAAALADGQVSLVLEPADAGPDSGK